MSIITDITAQQSARMIVEGIKAQIAHTIEAELTDYIKPMIKKIAIAQAENVCKEAVLRAERDLLHDEVKVLVQFKEAKP